MPAEFRTLESAIEFTRVCQSVRGPRHLMEQLGRASSSIALNLAEGSARSTRADRHRFYRVALGSLRESETILRIINETSPVLDELRKKLAGQLTNLCKSQENTA
jgi:four helix bundle protein